MFFAQKKSELAKNAKIHAFDAKISGEIDKTISNGARDGILSFRSRKPIRTIKIGNILWAVHNNSLQKPVRAGLAEADDGFTCTSCFALQYPPGQGPAAAATRRRFCGG